MSDSAPPAARTALTNVNLFVRDPERSRRAPRSGDWLAEDEARERMPSCFCSMTMPTEVTPLCRGMNHAQPDSSAGVGQV